MARGLGPSDSAFWGVIKGGKEHEVVSRRLAGFVEENMAMCG